MLPSRVGEEAWVEAESNTIRTQVCGFKSVSEVEKLSYALAYKLTTCISSSATVLQLLALWQKKPFVKRKKKVFWNTESAGSKWVQNGLEGLITVIANANDSSFCPSANPLQNGKSCIPRASWTKPIRMTIINADTLAMVKMNCTRWVQLTLKQLMKVNSTKYTDTPKCSDKHLQLLHHISNTYCIQPHF